MSSAGDRAPAICPADRRWGEIERCCDGSPSKAHVYPPFVWQGIDPLDPDADGDG